MRKKIHILNVVGTRPNFVKIAPLMHEYKKHPNDIKATLLHTGQHYDDELSGVFFSQLRIPKPDIYLGVGSGSHAQQTARIMVGFEKELIKNPVDLVLVVGDVNSTMACALVAAKLNIPIAHVEAGLRSNDRSMPEEINRIITDSLADFLFTTSTDANVNLLREGKPQEKIFFVGNTMVDSLLAWKSKLDGGEAKERFHLNGESFGFVTLHRPSNVDDKRVLSGIYGALNEVQKHIKLLWPLHPRSRKMLQKHGLLAKLESMKNLILTDPLNYVDCISLMGSAAFVMTDSGGIQEETTAMGIPCLTLRNNTERPVTVLEGTNEVIGTDALVIAEKAFSLIQGKGKTGRIPKYWDGKASKRIISILLRNLKSSMNFR